MAVTESFIKSNHAASVPDTSASLEQMSQANWLQSRGIKVEERVRLARLSHMRYQTPDLDALCDFMLSLCHQGVFICQMQAKQYRFWNGGSQKNRK